MPVPRLGKVTLLPRDVSLARGCPPAPVGTLFVQGVYGGMRVEPDAGFPVVFGRNEPEVHVCVGPDDTNVSRRQGRITRDGSRWILSNIGAPMIRFPDSSLIGHGQQAVLPMAYTPLFIHTRAREHLLEVRVAAGSPPPAGTAETYSATTGRPDKWDLTDRQRLVLVCLGQRYLRQEPQPQPMAWEDVATKLRDLEPDKDWNWRKAAGLMDRLRAWLSSPERGTRRVAGLRADEVPQPIGNTLNHNLIMEMLVTTTITTDDLELIGG